MRDLYILVGIVLGFIAVAFFTTGGSTVYAAMVNRQARADQRELRERAASIDATLASEARRGKALMDDIERVWANQRRARYEAAESEKCDVALFYERSLERDELQRRYKAREAGR